MIEKVLGPMTGDCEGRLDELRHWWRTAPDLEAARQAAEHEVDDWVWSTDLWGWWMEPYVRQRMGESASPRRLQHPPELLEHVAQYGLDHAGQVRVGRAYGATSRDVTTVVIDRVPAGVRQYVYD